MLFQTGAHKGQHRDQKGVGDRFVHDQTRRRIFKQQRQTAVDGVGAQVESAEQRRRRVGQIAKVDAAHDEAGYAERDQSREAQQQTERRQGKEMDQTVVERFLAADQRCQNVAPAAGGDRPRLAREHDLHHAVVLQALRRDIEDGVAGGVRQKAVGAAPVGADLFAVGVNVQPCVRHLNDQIFVLVGYFGQPAANACGFKPSAVQPVVVGVAPVAAVQGIGAGDGGGFSGVSSGPRDDHAHNACADQCGKNQIEAHQPQVVCFSDMFHFITRAFRFYIL